LVIAHADDDLWHPEQEGLEPELHQLPVEVIQVSITADLGAGFEFDPIDRRAIFCRLRVPDFDREYRGSAAFNMRKNSWRAA
jgi:hypothetical protein